MKYLKGSLSGLIGSIFYTLMSILIRMPFAKILNSYRDEISYMMRRHDITNPTLYGYIKLYLFYIIFGMIFGSFYTMIKESIPGKNFLTKGFVYGIIVWMFTSFFRNILNFIEFKIYFVPFLIGTFAMEFSCILLSAIIISMVQEKFIKT